MSFTTSSRIFVAGHRGLVGSAITRHLQSLGYNNLLLRTRAELDLRDSQAVNAFFAEDKPEYVFLAVPPKLGASSPTPPTPQILFTTISPSKPMSSNPPFATTLPSFSFSAPPASIQNSRRSRSKRNTFSPARSNPLTSGMPSPKSPA